MCKRMLAAVLVVGVLTGASSQAELADPTRPARARRQPSSSIEAAEGALILHSVMLSKHRSVAVINRRRVRMGDWAFGARVVEISLAGVRLRGPNGEILLTLAGASFKQPAGSREIPR